MKRLDQIHGREMHEATIMSAVTISIMLKDVIAMRRREPMIVNIVGFARQPTVFPL